jgi:ElaA protein
LSPAPTPFPEAGSPALRWRCLPFGALSPHTLYALLRLRAQVFVVEQACTFQDLDGADPACLHLLGEQPGEGGALLLASARLVPPGLLLREASIGRVVTAPEARGRGLGHALVRESVRQLHQLWGEQPIRIGAQAHLEAFYRQHGFTPAGPLYMEDGIAHREMLRT